MSKIILDSVGTTYSSAEKINDNFQKIEDALNNSVLYRDLIEGEPNSMKSDFDMNAKNILNTGSIDTDTLQVNSMTIGGSPVTNLSQVDVYGASVAYSVNEIAARTAPTSAEEVIILSDGKRSGIFIWSSANESAKVAIDTVKGVYIPPNSDTSGASGAWVRELSGFLTPEMFGCVNDDGTDSHARLTAGIALADYLRMTFNFGSGKYLISAELELPFSVQIDAGSRASIEPYGGYTGTAISIGDGNGHRINLPSVSGFSTGAGLLLKGTNVAQINIKNISGCEDGVVLQTVAAAHSTVLDCNVTVQQIGNCTNGIVFESDTYTNIMQGNYVYCNFISKTEYPVLFRDNGGHTQQAYWDSNRVETEAIDPINAGASIILYNSTPYTVPRLRFYVNSWLGGFKSGDLLISGSFTGGDFLFSFAQAMDMDRIDPSSVSSIASCTIKICGGRNFGAGDSAFAETVDSSDYTTFNSGAPFYLGNNALMVTLPVDLADGESTVAPRCFHFLAKSSYMPHFSLDNMQLSPRAYIYAVPAGTEQDGMIRVGITNLSGGTLFAGQQWRCNLRVD